MISSLTLTLCLLAGAAADEAAAPGQQEASPEAASWRPLSAQERATREALDRGLAYLAARLRETPDGAFPRGARGESREWAPVGVTALGTLAFMAGGHSPGRGPYGREVARAVDYLLAMSDLSPQAKHYGYISNQGDSLSRTHGHGYATLALAEAYGMSPRSERLKHALQAAVQLIEGSQGAEGGWYYEPAVSANHEGSTTICMLQALRAARNSGIQVQDEVVHKAENYVVRLQKPDGTFRYQLDREDSSVALTAAAVATLNMAGRYDDTVIESSVNAIWSRLSLRETEGEEVTFPIYERLHLAQAFWQLTDSSHFERWYTGEAKRLVMTQREDGSWRDERYGDCYATAMHCLVLAIPEGVLPIFQR